MEKKFELANELLTQEAFLAQLKEAKAHEDVQALFAQNGVELSVEDIELMCQQAAAAHGNEELSEEDLGNVSGGIILTASTIACFALATASLGFYTSYGYHYVKSNWKKRR